MSSDLWVGIYGLSGALESEGRCFISIQGKTRPLFCRRIMPAGLVVLAVELRRQMETSLLFGLVGLFLCTSSRAGLSGEQYILFVPDACGAKRD